MQLEDFVKFLFNYSSIHLVRRNKMVKCGSLNIVSRLYCYGSRQRIAVLINLESELCYCFGT